VKIRNKIVIYYTILFIVCIGFIGFLVTKELQDYMQDLIIQRLSDHVVSHQELYIPTDQFSSGQELLNSYGERIAKELSNNNVNIRIYTFEQQIAAASSGIALTYNHSKLAWNEAVRTALDGRSAYHLNNDLLYFAVPIDYQGEVIGAIEYIYPYTTELRTIHFFLRTFIYIGVIGLLLVIIMSFIISQKITSPVHKLIQSVKLFSQGTFQKVENMPADEVGTLAQTFNWMGKTIEQQMNDITQEKDKLNNLLGHLQEGILAFNEANEILFENRKAVAYLSGINDDLLNSFKLQLQGMQHMAKDWSIDDKIYYLDISKWDQMYIVVLRDITQDRQWIKNQKQFVANVSHELKTPVTAINGYIQLMQQEKQYDEEVAAYMEKEGIRLKDLILDLLDLSRLESQYADIEKRTFSLKSTIQSIVENMRIKGNKYRITITEELEDLWILGDENKISQTIINLLDNAIKYSKPGKKIYIQLAKKDKKARITIQDEGIGIAESELKHVFERFYRSTNARDIGGNGLGLSIVKEIIEKHDGSIQISSKLHQGTIVTIELPTLLMGD